MEPNSFTMRVSYGLAVFLAGAFIALLIYGTDFLHVSDFACPKAPTEGCIKRPSPESAGIDTEASEAAVLATARAVDETRSGTTEEDRSSAGDDDENRASAEHSVDEDSVRKARASAVREVREAYALLLEDLHLAPPEKERLFELLVEVRMAGTWVIQNGSAAQIGAPIAPGDRPRRIAAIIGHTELQRFLALESNVDSYRETYRIGSLLERRGVPLSEAQSNGLFDVLVATRDQVFATMPPSDAELGSLESVERTLARIDERERHVIELAPSLLSPEQVVYLHESYQRCSYERSDDLQRQIDRSANRSEEDFKFGYRPCGP